MKLNEFGFEKTHLLKIEGNTARFEAINSSELESAQDADGYAWCGVKNDSLEVLYIGKAGSGVDMRLNQHEGGFKYNKTGQKNLKLLLDKSAQGYAIEVHSRKAETKKFLALKLHFIQPKKRLL